MTLLRKTVERETSYTQSYRGRRRPVIVALMPGNLVGVRLKGCPRSSVASVPLDWLFFEAHRRKAAQEEAKKKNRRQTK
jgi:hypothetical protein